jgi:hypothetical protein
MRSVTTCCPHQILFGGSNEGGLSGWGMWILRRNMKIRDHPQDLGVEGRIIVKL